MCLLCSIDVFYMHSMCSVHVYSFTLLQYMYTTFMSDINPIVFLFYLYKIRNELRRYLPEPICTGIEGEFNVINALWFYLLWSQGCLHVHVHHDIYSRCMYKAY